MEYTILWDCVVNKGYIFGVAFGSLLCFLPDRFNWFWVIPPGPALLSCKISGWHPIHLSLTLSSLYVLFFNILLNIRMIAKANKRWVKNSSGVFFTCCRINVYGFKYIICVWHDILRILFNISTIWFIFLLEL